MISTLVLSKKWNWYLRKYFVDNFSRRKLKSFNCFLTTGKREHNAENFDYDWKNRWNISSQHGGAIQRDWYFEKVIDAILKMNIFITLVPSIITQFSIKIKKNIFFRRCLYKVFKEVSTFFLLSLCGFNFISLVNI